MKGKKIFKALRYKTGFNSIMPVRGLISLAFLLNLVLVPLLIVTADYFRGSRDADLMPTAAASTQSAAPKGARRLSINVNSAENGNFSQALEKAISTGMQDVPLVLDWSDIESKPKVYSNYWLNIANTYWPPMNVGVNLTLRPISTNRKCVPEDLAKVAFNDERMISRFKNLLDFVLNETRNIKYSSISIGSEIDIYFRSQVKNESLAPSRLRLLSSPFTFFQSAPNPSTSGSKLGWSQYTEFCKAVSQHIRDRRPDIKIAFEATYWGLTSLNKDDLKPLIELSDIVGVSYFPVNQDYSVKDIGTIGDDFRNLVSLYPNRKIYFYQLGCPSSTLLNSSEEKQAQFVNTVFSLWHTYASQIEMINFLHMHDCSQEYADYESKYFGLTDRRYSEFIKTLGLRRYPGAGEDKPAYLALLKATSAWK